VTTDKQVPILFLDLDGTVRKGFDEIGKFVNCVGDVEIFPEVPKLIENYKKKGFRIVGITNQGDISLGLMTEQNLRENINRTNSLCDNKFDLILACQHHPDSHVKQMSRCFCRKPRIGNVVLACCLLGQRYRGEYYPPHICLFVGDREEDRQCAENANIDFIWAKDWRKKKLEAMA